MALDFPSNPTDGQVYGNFYYSASKGAWRSTTSFNTPSQLTNAVITDNAATAVPLTVKGYTSQSANLQNWADSSGTTLASINSTGVPTFPGGNFNSPVNFNVGGVRTIELGGSNYGSIEIGKVDGSATTPFIDFHSSTSAADYNARIIADGGTSTAGSGNLSIQASKLTLPTNTYAPGAIVQVATAQTSATQYSIAAADITAITGLSISFTPKFSNSKILLQAMINSSATYVATYGFLKNGGYLSGVTNTNSQGSVATTYYGGAIVESNAYNNFITYVDTPGTTSAITYAAGACSSWNGTNSTLWINDRSDGSMRGISTLTIFEIAV